MQEKIGYLRATVKALTKRKSRKRRHVQAEETLTVGKVTNLIAKKEGSSYKESKTPTKRARIERRYSRYSKIRYNFRTYKIEIREVEDSNASK